jgi:hypothetical protein
LNGIYQIVVYTYDVNLLEENMHTRKKKDTEALLMATKEFGLEIRTEQTKYRFMSRKQNIGQSHSRKVSNKSIEKVAKLIVFGNDTNKAEMHAKDDKSRLRSGNACYHLDHII